MAPPDLHDRFDAARRRPRGVDLITDPDILAGYLTDASNTHGHAEGLVRVAGEHDVCLALGRRA